jgi:hypothetical protein
VNRNAGAFLQRTCTLVFTGAQGAPLLIERFDARTLLDVLPEEAPEPGLPATLESLRAADADVTPQARLPVNER